MALYHRYAVCVPMEAGRYVFRSLPLVAAESPAPRLLDLKSLDIVDPETERLYVLNYDNYYVVSPGCFEKIVVPMPVEPMRFEDAPPEHLRDLPRYTFDLLPCPKTLQPFPGLQVCVDSRFRGAVFLHPDRPSPTDQERRVRVESFGTIELNPASKDDYGWRAWVAPGTGLGKILGLKKLVKKFADQNGEYEAGSFKA
jgi:hypothetical protein